MKKGYKRFPLFFILLIVLITFLLFSLIPEKKFQGYVIKDTKLLLYCSDFPYFWGSIKKQKVANSATAHLFNYLYDLELFVRKEIGIRPTPFRWNLWAGKPLLISWNEQGDYLVSLKPNLLFRFFIPPSYYQQKEHIDNNWDKNGKLYYLWKEGELLISNKDKALQQSVLFSAKPINIDKNSAYIELGNKVKASLNLHVKKNLYIDGKIIPNRKTDTNLPHILNFNNSSFSFTFSCYPLIDLLSDIPLQNTILSLIPKKTLHPIFAWLSTFKNTTIENLYQRICDKEIVRKSNFLFSGISDKFSSPIPVFGFWFPYENNDIQNLLSELDLDLIYYPHQWGASQEYIVPIWSNALCLSFLYFEKGWLVCSQESLMSVLLESFREDKENSETASILTINLSEMSEDIEKIFLWSARQELLIGINERDMSSIYSPWKQFLKELGTFTITIRSTEQQGETHFLIHGGFDNEN